MYMKVGKINLRREKDKLQLIKTTTNWYPILSSIVLPLRDPNMTSRKGWSLKCDHCWYHSLAHSGSCCYNWSFPRVRFPEGFYFGGPTSPSEFPIFWFIFLSTNTIMQGKDFLCSFFQANKVLLRWSYLSFQKLSMASFLLDNDVLIPGPVIEKPALCLLLDAIFSVLVHQLRRCSGGISVIWADDQVTEAIMY